MKTGNLVYLDNNVSCNGHFAYDESTSAPTPGVLVVHEAFGLGAHAMERAESLAELGYVALAVDMFGGRRQAKDLSEAMTLMGQLSPAEIRSRITAGLHALLGMPHVDSTRVGAIGFCFGGSTVLELARSGANVGGVVSFHGALTARAPIDGPIKAKILVCHGADDPMVTSDQMTAFQTEMRQAKADWQVNIHGNAVHSFTNREAAHAGVPGLNYNEPADRRSWAAMQYFFTEIFGTNGVRMASHHA